MEELDKRLGRRDPEWDVSSIHKKDLLATLHLLVAMVRHFQPELELPSDVKVQVALVEVSGTGIRSDVRSEVLTGESSHSDNLGSTHGDANQVEELLRMEAHEVALAKQALLDFTTFASFVASSFCGPTRINVLMVSRSAKFCNKFLN
ncbi:gamma-parvin-like isoform X3 [Hippocampus comes]|uniref:gamma-parvin-like isoform X3 n=1 Tax=Hippocampus comes TaxID=109280 RepID=UPI00094EE979|nr:PREDICTED: gamma-parvin-like isoform X3 [Hippocampus comes]